MLRIPVKKETYSRLHKFCHKGERHDNLINRLLDTLEVKQDLNINGGTWERLCGMFNVSDPDELLNMLMDRCTNHIKKK